MPMVYHSVRPKNVNVQPGAASNTSAQPDWPLTMPVSEFSSTNASFCPLPFRSPYFTEPKYSVVPSSSLSYLPLRRVTLGYLKFFQSTFSMSQSPDGDSHPFAAGAAAGGALLSVLAS